MENDKLRAEIKAGMVDPEHADVEESSIASEKNSADLELKWIRGD